MSNLEPRDIEKIKQEVSQTFNAVAPVFDRVGPAFFAHFGRRLVEFARIPKGVSVLDVATGRGALLFPALEAVGAQGRVVGIDISQNMVRETARELAKLPGSTNAKLLLMDAENLGFPDGSFDFVLCGFGIFFFPRLERALAEFQRVLKPDGKICISTWDKTFAESWSWCFEIAKTYLPPEPEAAQQGTADAEHTPVFDTPEGVREIMQTGGFETIQVTPESTVFNFVSEAEFLAFLWSCGTRDLLAKLEQAAGPQGYERFKAEFFTKTSTFKQNGGIPQVFPAIFTLAVRSNK
jgi:ubiquinone/menaquinone biosynthesis C-methylase UbiE